MVRAERLEPRLQPRKPDDPDGDPKPPSEAYNAVLTGAGVTEMEDCKRVLVVEDDPVVAMVMEDTLRAMGLEVLVDLNLVDALNEVEASRLDAAMIDVGLRGENAWPVMVALQKRNVPFAVMSGGDLSELAEEFPRVRMLNKPLSVDMLQQIVRELLASPPASTGG